MDENSLLYCYGYKTNLQVSVEGFFINCQISKVIQYVIPYKVLENNIIKHGSMHIFQRFTPKIRAGAGKYFKLNYI